MDTKSKKTTEQAVTQEQIDLWKKKHRDVWMVTVVGDDDKEYTCYMRKPDRKQLSLAMRLSQKDPLKFNESIINGCWLAGDEEIKTDDELFMAVSTRLDELINYKEAEIKKL